MKTIESAIVYDNVSLGTNPTIGVYVILGEPPRGAKAGEHPLVIGDNCVIRSSTTIYAGNKIGNNFQCGHNAFFREDNFIGDNVSVGTNTVIEHHVVIGNNVRVHSQAFIPEYCVLEDNCWIGPNVVLTNAPYPCGVRAKDELRGVKVEKNARIGANATVLPGLTIGEGSLVGAGAVVTKNVEPFSVVAGNPAKRMGSTNDLTYEDGTSVYKVAHNE